MALSNDINYWFDFDEQDIIANRQGHMSHRQLDDIRKSIILRRIMYGLVGTIAFFPICILLIVLTDGIGYKFKWEMWLGIVIILLVVCLILIRNLYTDNKKAKKQPRPIHSIQGQIRLYSQPRFYKGGGTMYRVRIDDRLTFHVGYQQWKCFEDGAHYILYYSLQSFRILSLEKIPATDV